MNSHRQTKAQRNRITLVGRFQGFNFSLRRRFKNHVKRTFPYTAP
nr:MAG TPA: hypothetical protein [Caudoviricetes sp.]